MGVLEKVYEYVGRKFEEGSFREALKYVFKIIAIANEYFDKEKDEVLIVSNNFHVFRAVGIARRQGYQKVSGLAARGYWFLLPNNMLREFVGVCKDLILGI